MKQEDIDTLWFKALDESIKQGELYTRYKFAELIVRECVTICNSVQEQYGQYTFTATTVKNRIQEHFGVAE